MSEKQYRDQISRLSKELAYLRKDEATALADAGKHRAASAAARSKTKSTSSSSTARSNEKATQRESRQAEGKEKKAADLAKKIAACTKKLNVANFNLASAQQSALRSDEQAAARRRKTEMDHARKVARISRPAVRHVHEIHQVPSPQIEELRLLYLTASPHGDLRVDAEVAQVQRAVRSALHREFLQIAHRPAATPEDLLDGLNDLTPHIVHFSGHGGNGAVSMDNSEIEDPTVREVTLNRLGRALGTATKPPSLLVFNACDTVEGVADELLPTVPLVIAMASSVLDSTAAIFAARFYAAVAAGLSIRKAFDQGVLAVDFAGLDEESWMITLLNRDDVDPANVVLVRPPAPGADEDHGESQ